MKWRRPWLITSLYAIGLLCSAVALVVAAGSYVGGFTLTHSSGHGARLAADKATPWRQDNFYVTAGWFNLQRQGVDMTGAVPAGASFSESAGWGSQPAGIVWNLFSTAGPLPPHNAHWWGMFGYEYSHSSDHPWTQYPTVLLQSFHFDIQISLWVITLSLSGATVWLGLVRRNLMRRLRMAEQICIKCGYDLRATPERCPECGTIPRTAKGAAT